MSSRHRVFLQLRFVPAIVSAALILTLLTPVAPPVNAQTIFATIPVGDSPAGIAINPLTNRIYVANSYSRDISVINAGTHTVIATWPIGYGAGPLAINRLTNRLYAGTTTTDYLLVLDGASGNRVGAIDELVQRSSHIAVNAQTNRIYICDMSGLIGSPDRLLIYDGATNARITTINLGVDPAWQYLSVTVNEQTNMVYVAYSLNSTVFFIDGNSNAVVREVHCSTAPAVAHSQHGACSVRPSFAFLTGVVGLRGRPTTRLNLLCPAT